MYCEGKVTERIYLDGVKQRLRNAGVQIVVGPKHGEPLGLVKAAASHVEQAGRRAPRGFDEVWCVFDVESPAQHGSLDEAVDLADAKRIRCAISDPCFELWLLLHFSEHGGHLTTEAACKLLEAKKCCGYTVDRKSFDFTVVLPHQDAAVERARRLADRHAGRALGKRNPGSDVHLLLDALRSGSPQR